MADGGPAEAEQSAGRLFLDAQGRRWKVTFSRVDDGGALQFDCLSDSRLPGRVMSVASALSLLGVSDEALRIYLHDAPNLERLTE